MSTLDQLEAKKTRLSIQDYNWRTFVYDHRAIIREKGSAVVITDTMISRYQNKYHHLLRSNGCIPELMWIGMLINDASIDSPIAPDDIIHIPSSSHINDLYRQYRTSISAR